MKINTVTTTILAMACLSMTAPALAFDQSKKQRTSHTSHRKQKQNEWRNIGIASGAAALLGLVGKNGTVATIGTAGALYSAYRYEEDRKSMKKQDRARAELYSRSTVVIDGHKYKRKTVKKNGKKYYQFVRA